MAKITEMIAQRSPMYEAAASIIIDTDKFSHFEVADEIIGRMKVR